MFEADSQNFAWAPLAPRGFKLQNFRLAFGADHRGTGGGSQPNPPSDPPPPLLIHGWGCLCHSNFAPASPQFPTISSNVLLLDWTLRDCYPPPPSAPGQRHGQQPVSGTADPGVVKQDKSSGGSVDTTKTRSGPQRVRMSSGEGSIGAAKGKHRGLVRTPPPSPLRLLVPLRIPTFARNQPAH